jgi:hypothetical protein
MLLHIRQNNTFAGYQDILAFTGLPGLFVGIIEALNIHYRTP